MKNFTKKYIGLVFIAFFLSLGAQNKKIAFIGQAATYNDNIPAAQDGLTYDDDRAAAVWFMDEFIPSQNNIDGSYFSFQDVAEGADLSSFDVLWIQSDGATFPGRLNEWPRGTTEGGGERHCVITEAGFEWNGGNAACITLEDNFINSIRTFYEAGGNIFLGNFAGKGLEVFGVFDGLTNPWEYKPNQTFGEVNSITDDWAVNNPWGNFYQDSVSNPLRTGFVLGSPDNACNDGRYIEFLTAGSGKKNRVCQYNLDFGRINDDANANNGGSATLAQKYTEFETTLNAQILLTNCGGNEIQSVQFNPRTVGKGTVIINGGGSYDWYADGSPANYNNNIKIFTANALLSLADMASYNIYANSITNGNWSETGTWINGVVPSTSTKVIVENDVILNQNSTIESLNITSASSLVLNAANGLTINDNLSNNGTLTAQSGSSLIVKGDASGNVIYNRSINAVAGNLKGWYLMASPVIGQDYDDTFVSANNIAENGSNNGIASYIVASDSWDYHEDLENNTFSSGTGYSVKRESTGTVAFTGTINTNDLGVDVVLTTGGNNFNLLGNPYTSYLNSATFLNDESAISETKTMWVYNQTLGSNGSYEVKTMADAFVIAPGQGFFIKANAAGGTFNFAEVNQSHNADTFQKASKTELKLSITDGTINQYAKVYYLDNGTTGFDVGYEGEVFDGNKEDFYLYSTLLSENQNKMYQVQALPNTGFESMIIPFGLKADAGKQITFTIEATNLPSGINVYLEDRLLKTYTRLDEAYSNYKVTLSESLNKTGRFFIHTKAANSLSTASEILKTVSMYKTDNNTLKIAGLKNGNASISLHNILGQKVMQTTFEATISKDITLPNLAKGVYVVNLQTTEGKLSKKIILE